MAKTDKLGEDTIVEEERIEVCDDGVQKVSQKQISLATTEYYRHGTWFFASFHSTLIMIVATGRFSGELFQDVTSFQQSGVPQFLYLPRWFFFGVCTAIIMGCILSYFAAELLIVSLEHDKQKFETFQQQPLNPKLNQSQKFNQCVFLVYGGVAYIFSLLILSCDILQVVAIQPKARLFCLLYVLLQCFFCFLPDFHFFRFVSLSGILVSICYPLLYIINDIVLSFINKGTIDVSNEVVIDLPVGFSILIALIGLLTVCTLQQGRKTLAFSVVFLILLAVAVILGIFVDDYISGRPIWLVTTAKIMVFLQIAAGCQIFSMVLFLAVEKGIFKQLIDQPAGILQWIFRVVFTIFMVVACVYVPIFSVVIGSFGGHAGYLGASILPFVIALKFFRNEIPKGWKISYVITIVLVILITIFATCVYFYLFRRMQ